MIPNIQNQFISIRENYRIQKLISYKYILSFVKMKNNKETFFKSYNVMFILFVTFIENSYEKI